MDYYGRDHKLSEGMGGVPQDLNDFLEQDMFTPPVPTLQDGMVGLSFDQDWLDNFLDDPVLNDRMMSDALQPPNVRSEHSYSLSNGETANPDSPLNLKVENMEKDMETDIINTVNPNMTISPAQPSPTTEILTTTSQGTLDLSLSSTTHPPTVASSTTQQSVVKQEEVDDIFTALTVAAQTATQPPVLQKAFSPASSSSSSLMSCSSPAVTVMRTHPQIQTAANTGAGQTLLKQPTIILATQPSLHTTHHVKQERLVLPKVNIKVEPMDSSSDTSSPEHYSMYDSIGLPPTPPGSSSSSGSDSEGGLSPHRSIPSSPIRGSSQSRHMPLMRPLSPTLSQPLFTSPIPTSGILILTEEEKRTLISEGYPIPGKLPLTKQEEKNLKKIRRKIKNKISAQESRRKKKEYLETLEKKVESYNQENNDLRKKVDHLENNNRSLLGQLHKLQSLVGKMRDVTPSTTQTGTCLMVLVLCFAVFLGTWSPMSLSIGYRGFLSQSSMGGDSGLSAPMAVPDSNPYVAARSNGAPPMGPEIQDPVSDTYSTPNIKSRVLLSLRDEREEPFGPHAPFSYRDFFMHWFSSGASCVDDNNPMEYGMMAPIPNVMESAAPLSFIESHDLIAKREQMSHQPENQTDTVVQYTAQVMTVPRSMNTTA